MIENIEWFGLIFLASASLLTLFLLIIRALAKELEATGLVCLRVWRRLQTERLKTRGLLSRQQTPTIKQQAQSGPEIRSSSDPDRNRFPERHIATKS